MNLEVPDFVVFKFSRQLLQLDLLLVRFCTIPQLIEFRHRFPVISVRMQHVSTSRRTTVARKMDKNTSLDLASKSGVRIPLRSLSPRDDPNLSMYT